MKQPIKTIIFAGSILLMIVLLMNCNSMKMTFLKSTEDFDTFYDKFHNDSAFQMSRIQFPLEGKSVSPSGTTQWTRDNWNLIKTKIYNVDTSQYNVNYNKTEDTFTQKVWLEDAGFKWKCRFELIDKKWYLVYVLDQNL